MKVLHMISGGDKGGAKTAVFSLLLALDERIDITIACFTEGVFYQEVQELPVRSVLFRQRFRNDLSIIPQLKRYIRSEGFDIVHAHGARANFICMMLKPWVKIPYVTTVHSDYKLDFTDKLYKRIFYTGLNALALRRMDYFIGVSEAFRTMLVGRGFDAGRVFAVHNTVEQGRAENFAAKEEFLTRHGINAHGKTLVGIIGRLDYVKGHDIFLRAAAEIAKTRDDVLFLLAGEGFEEANLRKLARSLGIAERVVFMGFVQDIFSFINAIDVNVCASRSESFAYMLHEGALMKKPAVSTDVGGVGELIRHNDTGLLVPEGDFSALAQAITRYITDPALAQAHGEALHTHATAHFSKEAMQEKSIQIYREIISREKREGRVFDVMLSGYYGYANSGDDALLDAVLHSLRREKPDISVLVLSRNPAETTRHTQAFSVNRFNLPSIRKYMKRTRLLVYGGGSHMHDVTSTRSLMYYTFLIHLAKRVGMRVMLYANGIGPINRPRNITKARRALEKCDYISLRDPQSYDFVRKIGVRKENIQVSVDAVFSLGGSTAADVPVMSGGYFAVSLRPWPFSEPNFLEKIAAAVNHTAQVYSLTPLLIPMQPEDLKILRELAKKIVGEYVLLPRVYGYAELMQAIRRAEFAMCMRLHGLVYAAIEGLPLIGLVYDPKVASFIEYMGEETTVDTCDLDLPRLKAMIDGIMADPCAARQRIAAARDRMSALSMRDAQAAVELL